MNERLRQWLRQQADDLVATTMYRAHNLLPDKEDVDAFVDLLANYIGATRDTQLSAIQFWALTSIGYDAPAAYDWLTVLRVLKQEIGNGLSRDFHPAEALRFWQELDDVHTFALIEASQIASDMDRTSVLEHMAGLRREIERFEQSKSNFIAVAAHELRTPLTILEGYANMLRMETEPDSRLRIFIDGLENGIQRMKLIINDLIDISLIDLQSIDLNYQLIDIERIVILVVDSLDKYFYQRQVDLIIMPFVGEQQTYGDPEKLAKAFAKVFTNALKYTPDGGRVTVIGETARMEEAAGDVAGYMDIQITDTGIGIDSDNLETIFGRFATTSDVTLHSSSKTNFRGGGPGLGLPIVRGIVEAHGGRIWAESPGCDEETCPGSAFHLELPIWVKKPEPLG
ncbi:MAG: HAMP domain-containing histidine kinase [Chloroflexi bacterium]|nr:HAMP domain-containing histidine kinase [Chloroflexota bacterium]